MKKHMMWCLFLATAACGDGNTVPGLQPLTHNEDAERWSELDDPAKFGEALEYSLDALPKSGKVKTVPWVGGYWPMAMDSINYPWEGWGSESASSKYGRAFGIYNVEGAVSAYHGVDAVNTRWCHFDAQCGGWGEVCARRAGYYTGRCIPGWWGLCHAWATASIMYPEPRRQVVKNGVLFKITDIKALMTLVHHVPKLKQVSLRCDVPRPIIPYDVVGRSLDPSCRDANPGTFHLLLANYIGLKQLSFIEDRDIGQDVWNQPLRSYNIRAMRDVTPSQANQLLHVGNSIYPYNKRATRLVYIVNDVQFIRESQPQRETDGNLAALVDQFTGTDRYEYILELDSAGKIIGGEWVGASKMDHPDFLWLPLGVDSNVAAGGTVQFDAVMDLAKASF